MTRFSRSRLVAGTVGCLVVAAIVEAARLWVRGEGPLWQAGQILLNVGFWFAIVLGAVLLLQASGLLFVSFPGSARAARAGLLVGAGIALGLIFVFGLGAHYWSIFTGSQPPGFLSFVIDPVFSLLLATAGSLLALACLALLSKQDDPPNP